MQLDFNPRSKHFSAVKKTRPGTGASKPQQQHSAGSDKDLLPLYPVFKDQTVQQVVVSDLKALTAQPAPERAQVSVRKAAA